MELSGLVTILIVLAIIGLIVYLLVTYIPMPQPFKVVIIAVALLVLLVWLLGGGMPHIK